MSTWHGWTASRPINPKTMIVTFGEQGNKNIPNIASIYILVKGNNRLQALQEANKITRGTCLFVQEFRQEIIDSLHRMGFSEMPVQEYILRRDK